VADANSIKQLPQLGDPQFATAARFWVKLGLISFGGPAGQIAIMHREIVERRRWVDEGRFASALNFCMLLPGPEAMQLAIYLGWRLHGIRGGLTAGLAFIGPAILLLLALSYVYAAYGQVPAIAGMLVGLKAAVVALVLEALLKIGRRALRGPLHVALAIGAFAALQFLHVPFPLIVLGAGLIGLAAGAVGGGRAASAPVPTRVGQPVRVLSIALGLWLVPLLACVAALGFDSLWSRLYLFFTQAALVTFGGAYAVLGYVTQHLVNDLGWLTAEQAVSGLALAETTPGPLIIVLQFMGFMVGWNQPSPLAPEAAAVLAAFLASWATFLPSFVFILVGAPYVERISSQPRVASALAAITAAVVGIIGTLAVLFARVVLLPQGFDGGPDWVAIAIAGAVWLLSQRTRLDLPWILAGAAVAGLLASNWLGAN
jgi:chromate transporter